MSSSQVGLSWTASTDNVGVVGYRVVRNGSVIATVAGTTYTDTTVSASTSYTYQIVAFDAAGNTASSGTLTVITPAPGTLFSDSFETGDLSQWTTNSGLTAETAHAHTGAYGAEESSTGVDHVRVQDPARQLHATVGYRVGLRGEPLHVGEPDRVPRQ